MIKQNPTKRDGFSYFFRDKRRTVFLKAPRGKEYHKFKIPKNKDPLKFIESLIIQSLEKTYKGFKVYYKKSGSITRLISKADTVLIKIPRGRKYHPFPLFKIPKKTLKESALLITMDYIARLDQLRRNREKAHREKEKLVIQESEEYEEPSEAVDQTEIEYEIYGDSGFYSSDRFGITGYTYRYMIVIPEILITAGNVENILDYIYNSAFDLILDQLMDMGVRDDQFFRLRLMGSGDYLRTMRNGKRVEPYQDRFGFGLARDNFNEDMWEDFKELFIDTLRDKLTGKNSYLVRAGNQRLIFEGFHVEIYD